ncbi:transcriptional repressor [bacterium]|nr:transcriptional repressor [bacterium]
MNKINKKIKQKFIDSKYNMTPNRAIILNFLEGKNKPLSVDQINSSLKSIDRATIYRALKVFVEIGLVNYETVNLKKIYCLNDKPHHHIICSKCGKIEKVSCCHNFSKIKNFKNIEHTLTLRGICSNCLEKNKKDN